MSNYVSIQTVAAIAYGVYTWDANGAFYIAYGGLSAYGDYQRGNTRLEGPKLSDLSFGSSQYGEPIPMAWGAPRLPGAVWWASEKRGTTTTTGGKGGPDPEVTTTTYSIDLLIGLTDSASVRITRVWSNGKVVWTRKSGASAESLANSDGTNLWSRMTLYPGSDTQLPDPTYEAAVGTAEASAYRGRSYVFIEGLQIGQAGLVPNLQFELLMAGSYAIDTAVAGPTVAAPSMIGTPVGVGTTTMRIAVAQWNDPFDNNDVKVYDIDMLASTATQIGTFEVDDPPNERPTAGTSDRAVLVTNGLTFAKLYSVPGGGVVTFTLPDSILGASLRFALSGTTIVIGSQYGADSHKLYRFATTGGTALAASAALPEAVESIAIVGTTVYAAATDFSGDIYVLDLATLTLQETLTAPHADAVPTLFLIDGQLAVANNTPGDIYIYAQGVWSSIGTIPSAYRPDTNAFMTPCAVGGYIFGARLSVVVTDTLITWSALLTAAPGAQPIATVVDEICERAGMPAGSWDTSDLLEITRTVRSYSVGRVTTARAMLEQLAAMYFFEPVLRDKLYFRRIGKNPVMEIDFRDLAAAIDKADEQPFPMTVASDIEAPPLLALRYPNLNADHQAGTEYSDRMVATQAAVEQIDVAVGMTPDEAKAVVDAMVAQRTVTGLSAPLRLPLSYTQLDAGDVVTLAYDDGETYKLRLRRRREQSGVLEFEAVQDDSAAVPGTGVTDTTQQPANTVEAYTDMVIEPLDIPLLRDADDGPGWYIAARGDGSPWPGGVLLTSPDDVVFSTAVEVAESAVMGVTTTALADFNGGGWDESSSVTVSIGTGQAASSTRAAMDVDSTINVWLIGDEIIRARVATQVSAGVYTLTGLLRGLQGTEWAKGLHLVGDRAVLLQPRGLRRITEELAQRGVVRYLKGVTATFSADDVASQQFTNDDVCLKPLAPTGLRVVEQVGQNLLISWGRRSRLATAFLAPTGVPLGEALELYYVRIYQPSSPSVLLRTITATSESATYTRAQQIADGVSAGAQIEVTVEQVSQAVGAGYPARVLSYAAAQAMPQISTITLGGTFQTGTQLRATLGGTTFTHTTAGGDVNLAGAASALAAVIDASSSYAATASGGVITVTGPLSTAFSVVVSIPAGDNGVSTVITQDAATAQAGRSYQAYVTIINFVTGETQPIPAGKTFTVRVYRPSTTLVGTFSYTTTGSESRAQVYGGLIAACDANATLKAAGYAFGMTYIDGFEVGYFIGPAGVANVSLDTGASSPYLLSVSIQQLGQEEIPTDLPQLLEVGWQGTTTAGWTYRLVLGSETFNYTAVGGDDMTDVAAGIAALVDASANYTASLGSPTTATVYIAGAPAVPYDWTFAILSSTITMTSALVQTAQ